MSQYQAITSDHQTKRTQSDYAQQKQIYKYLYDKKLDRGSLDDFPMPKYEAAPWSTWESNYMLRQRMWRITGKLLKKY